MNTHTIGDLGIMLQWNQKKTQSKKNMRKDLTEDSIIEGKI